MEDAEFKEAINETDKKTTVLWSYAFFLLTFAPVLFGVILYHLEPLDPAELPLHELSQPVITPPRVNSKLLEGAEFIGAGQLVGPEDIAYDAKSEIIYVACADGWIKRLFLNNSAVENWVYVGGRPLGLAFGLNQQLIVADAYQGVLKLSMEGKVEVLTDEVEGRKLKFADGIDVAKDGMIYFTEASYKYNLSQFIFDILEGKPHGSLMSFDPVSRETKVLARDLYFPNGLQVAPDQNSVIFCETPMRRCKKYIRVGERKGSLETFVDNLPILPDNIRYDGEALYWIGCPTFAKPYWEIVLKYPILRKVLAIATKYNINMPRMEKNGGILAVDLEGKAVAHYYDPNLIMITGGYKIGNYLYIASLHYPHILRLHLATHAAK